MKLIAYPTGGVPCTIRRAPRSRVWMDQSDVHFAYRCLPLTIANTHGWEILCPSSFRAWWDGGTEKEAIRIEGEGAISHFGSGVLTFHPGYLFRTDPGVNLWASGPVNSPKDGITPLTGVIETDWAPYSFTMNWIFTRRGEWVEFEQGEPFCFFYPVPRGMVEETEPEIRELSEDLDTKIQHEEWVSSRAGFLRDLNLAGTEANKQKWQKNYSQGCDVKGDSIERHQKKPIFESAHGLFTVSSQLLPGLHRLKTAEPRIHLEPIIGQDRMAVTNLDNSRQRPSHLGQPLSSPLNFAPFTLQQDPRRLQRNPNSRLCIQHRCRIIVLPSLNSKAGHP